MVRSYEKCRILCGELYSLSERHQLAVSYRAQGLKFEKFKMSYPVVIGKWEQTFQETFPNYS